MCKNDALLKLNYRPIIILATRQIDSKDTGSTIANNSTKKQKRIYTTERI